MIRLGLVVLVSVVFTQCSAASGHRGELTPRYKRSPYYCGPGFPAWPPPPPPPPPPFPPPPPPDFFYWRRHPHHHSSEDYNDYRSKENIGDTEYKTKILINGQNNLGTDVSRHADLAQGNSGQGADLANPGLANPTQNNFGPSNTGQDNPPCDTCKGKNEAVSNAQSETGNAVAIAIARAKSR